MLLTMCVSFLHHEASHYKERALHLNVTGTAVYKRKPDDYKERPLHLDATGTAVNDSLWKTG